MTATLLDIMERRKRHLLAPASAADFRCRRRGSIDATVVVRDPAMSLYCIDQRNRRAVFVETPAGLDVLAHPFLYQAQYAHALRLIAVPLETLHALADRLEDGVRSLVVMFSIGRAGSTLMGRVFSAVPGTVTLGEPDVYTQIAAGRERAGDSESAALVRSVTRLLSRDARGRTIALKPRSTVVDLADLFHRVYPSARLLFLHRDAESWSRSMIRAFGLMGCPDFVSEVLARQPCVAAYLTRRRGVHPRPQRLAGRLRQIPAATALGLMWAGLTERAWTLRRDGVPLYEMRYDVLVADPEGTVRQIFEYCGVPVAHVAEACRAFERDAQADTPLSRARVRQQPSVAIDRQWHLTRSVIARCELS
jgi:hypothetical protein